MKIAVTGASGFVGRHLTAHLQERGHTVVAIDRRAWDLTSSASPAPLLGGRDAVVHLAGRVHVRPRPGDDDFVRTTMVTNVDGTRRLAEAAVERGVRRFVFDSSSTAHGNAAGAAAIDDSTPLTPDTA